MRRWNGWGDESVRAELPSRAVSRLRELLGPGHPMPDCPIQVLLDRIPASRLPEHPDISTDGKDRLDHGHGQSLPDWIALRWGTLDRVPDGVAFPSTLEQLRQILDLAWKQEWVVVPYGGGTSVVGHLQVPTTQRPVLSVSMERLNRLISLDGYAMLATFEAGVLGPEVERQLGQRGFTLGHFPQSFEYVSLGGCIATRSSGQQSRYYGRMDNLFAGGEVLSPEGTITLPPFPASAAGPDLRQIVLGSEGRLGVISKAIVRISRPPEVDDVHGVVFPNWDVSVEFAQRLGNTNLPLSMVRISNAQETQTTFALADRPIITKYLETYLRMRSICGQDGCMALLGICGPERLCAVARRELTAMVRAAGGVWIGAAMGRSWKKNRFHAPYLRNTIWDHGYAIDTLETSVTWDNLRMTYQMVEESIRSAFASANVPSHVFTHLSSVYSSGCSMYTTYLFPLSDSAKETYSHWKAAKEAASRAIVAQGGTITHQHGVGVDHQPYLAADKGPVGLAIIKAACAAADSRGLMNPQNLVT